MAVIFCTGAYLAWDYYGRIYRPNVHLEDESIVLFIRSNWDFEQVVKSLEENNIISSTSSFIWVANRKNYPSQIKAGRYIVFDGMSNNRLVDLLRSGEQKPVKLVMPSVRTVTEMAGIAGRTLELDSIDLMKLMTEPSFCGHYGFSTTTIACMFLPNTYEFYWNTNEQEFVERMALEFKRFWSEERLTKAQNIGMTQSEVTILASIVQSEQSAHPDERPVVAGLYLNRLRRGMRLESDPTLIHALGDFTIRRVLKVHRDIDSPYNTYKNVGLPPGPILLPELSAIDAVLNASDHNYIYMCAREDFSGYHNFSTTYSEHVNNARRYQTELNKRKIYR